MASVDLGSGEAEPEEIPLSLTEAHLLLLASLRGDTSIPERSELVGPSAGVRLASMAPILPAGGESMTPCSDWMESRQYDPIVKAAASAGADQAADYAKGQMGIDKNVSAEFKHKYGVSGITGRAELVVDTAVEDTQAALRGEQRHGFMSIRAELDQSAGFDRRQGSTPPARSWTCWWQGDSGREDAGRDDHHQEQGSVRRHGCHHRDQEPHAGRSEGRPAWRGERALRER